MSSLKVIGKDSRECISGVYSFTQWVVLQKKKAYKTET